MEQALTRLWYGDSAAALLLQPLALIYRTIVAARRVGYERGWLRSYELTRPVVVIGNLTVGGTGKTPLTTWIAQQLRSRGLRPGIVSRGYGRPEAEPRFVEVDDDWRRAGDEPILLRRHSGCPTVVAADRVAGARALIDGGVDLVLADDGLQHLRLARRCEIVVIDGARGFGNGRLLPAGPLRAPLQSLAGVDLFVVNGPDEHASLTAVPRALRMHLEISAAVNLSTGARRPLDTFRGERIHAAAGIGNPQRFFRALQARGLDVTQHAFPDHHAFSATDLEFGDTQPVLMTEKDAVKCTAFGDPRLWQVPLAVHFSAADERELLDHVLREVRLDSGTKG